MGHHCTAVHLAGAALLNMELSCEPKSQAAAQRGNMLFLRVTNHHRGCCAYAPCTMLSTTSATSPMSA